MDSRSGNRRSLLVVGVLAALLGSGNTSASSATGVNVSLTASGSTTIAQGESFEFEAEAHNPDPQPASVRVIFQIESFDGPEEDPVPFRAWRVSLDPSETETLAVAVPPSQWFASPGSFRITASLEPGTVVNELEVEVGSPLVLVPSFDDVTSRAGLNTIIPAANCGTHTAGAAWGDIDGDRDPDLFTPVREGASQLWVNDGAGRFNDEAAGRGIDLRADDNVSAVFADYDNDGDQDLFVVSYHQAHQLYRNDGTGHFMDVAVAAGVAEADSGASASWGDYDADGYLDLYVVDNIDCAGPEGEPRPDRLYHNEGDGTFTDRTALLPAEATEGSGFQAVWFDYDDDGDQDLYLGNDYFGPSRDHNHLWRNEGSGPAGSWKFTDVTEQSGTAFFVNSMGIAVGDYDRDLDLDFAVSDISGNVLARNDGDGSFADVAAEAHVERVYQYAWRTSITWGLGFYDLNLDGWEDLYVAAGSLPHTLDQPDQLFVNGGEGTFLDLSAPAGMVDPSIGRGVAFADYDRDGRVDIYALIQGGSPRLYRNTTPRAGRHWLEVFTTGALSNRDGCGARLTLTVRRARLLRQVLCGSSLGTGSDRSVHFGLGSASMASRLVIEWPSGKRQVFTNVAADRVLEAVEPG
jgi:hypothetical protein